MDSGRLQERPVWENSAQNSKGLRCWKEIKINYHKEEVYNKEKDHYPKENFQFSKEEENNFSVKINLFT